MNEWPWKRLKLVHQGSLLRAWTDTEAIGGWAWAAVRRSRARDVTIPSAIDARGDHFHHTAPVYGFGLSERIVGVMLSGGFARARNPSATQTGLEWRDGKVRRNSCPCARPKRGGGVRCDALPQIASIL